MSTVTAAPADRDERLAKVGMLRTVLVKPEFGALAGAVLIFAFFAVQSNVFRSVSGAANWLDVSSVLGLMAIPVALLMIGGQFDLSAGGPDGHGRSGHGCDDHVLGAEPVRVAGLLTAADAGDRPAERVSGHQDRPAQLHHHPGHVPGSAGDQPRSDQTDHQHRAGQQPRPGSRLRAPAEHHRQHGQHRRGRVPDRHRVVGGLHRVGRLLAHRDPLRQLGVRHRG